MATALARQLAQLNGLGPQERWARGKHSLLFDYQTAADVSAESLLGIAQQGAWQQQQPVLNDPSPLMCTGHADAATAVHDVLPTIAAVKHRECRGVTVTVCNACVSSLYCMPACAHLAGIEALCKVDRRFTPFTDSLFSRASLSITRDQLTKEENEQLDTNLSAFLRVLVNHFLMPAATQVLEYCIRRYQ